jgi:uncharacterized SAM-binding protein YcdF (DUF218 family)
MDFVLSKLLPMLMMPLFLAIMLAAGGFYFVLKNKKRLSLLTLAYSILMLYISAIPLTARILGNWWENRFQRPENGFESADAIVVLGGFTERVTGKGDALFFGGGIDRLLSGIDLWKQGRAPVLVLSGGTNPGSEFEKPEAETMRMFIRQYTSVPDSVLLLERLSVNTEENACFSGALLDSLGIKRDIILVTSAYHMERAHFLFKNAGFMVQPYPTDFDAVANRPLHFPFALLPSAEVLHYNSRLYREIIGNAWLRVTNGPQCR